MELADHNGRRFWATERNKRIFGEEKRGRRKSSSRGLNLKKWFTFHFLFLQRYFCANKTNSLFTFSFSLAACAKMLRRPPLNVGQWSGLGEWVGWMELQPLPCNYQPIKEQTSTAWEIVDQRSTLWMQESFTRESSSWRCNLCDNFDLCEPCMTKHGVNKTLS